MKMIWLFVFVGGFIGSLVPMLWGADYTSLWALLTGTIGSLVGIWAYTKMDFD